MEADSLGAGPSTHSRAMVHHSEFIQVLRSRTALSKAAQLSRHSVDYERQTMKQAYSGMLDRVNVLGNDEDYGHTGCVNALSWARDGEVLISGGDDTTVRLWRLDSSDLDTPYPFKCNAVINTGHGGNIFNAQLLPSSSRLVTVSGDGQVRVFDIERAMSVSSTAREERFRTSETCIRKFRCHRRRTKRVVTEESSDVFLTVAEDGAVRQHDLRTPHRCRSECPTPLVKLPFDLSSLSLSPLVPYYFTIAGESPYAYLFDRRQSGRILLEEWGVPCTTEDYVTCIRRLGRKERAKGEREGSEHITGTRMSQYNGHEILLSYSQDSVYLYSMYDEAHEDLETKSAAVVAPNAKKRKAASKLNDLKSESSDAGEILSSVSSSSESQEDSDATDGDLEELLQELRVRYARTDDGEDEEESNIDDEDVPSNPKRLSGKFHTPLLLPRRRFAGACNVETVKDVNFIGYEDDYVASGSDDGNFFLWEKQTGRLHGIYEGDGSVVNVIESHPRLPLLAVSGIDTTIKLFAPSRGESRFSRLDEATSIIERNGRRGHNAGVQLYSLHDMLTTYRAARRASGAGDDGTEDERCPLQ